MNEQPPICLEETIHVHPIECDFNKEWKPAAIFQHLTEIAGTHATMLGVGFDWMYAQNLFWVHSRMKVKYFGYAHANDSLMIRTWPKTIYRRLIFIRDFEVLDEAGQRLMTATSTWLIINATTRRMAPPKSVNLNLPEQIFPIGLDEPLERLDLAVDGEERLRHKAGYSAVDLVGHVNNSRYVEWICDAFPIETFKQRKLDYLQVNYEHEVLPGEEVSIRVNCVAETGSVGTENQFTQSDLLKPAREKDNLWAVEGRNLSNDTRAFEALLRWRD